MEILLSAEALRMASGWLLALFMGALGLVIIWKIGSGTIDLGMLLSEENGKASLSRLQFLIFTFIYGMGLVVVILNQETPGFPEDIPLSAFALMGISAGSYLASKGIQNARDGNTTIAETTQVRAEAVRAMGTTEFATSSRNLARASESLESTHLEGAANTLARATEQLASMDLDGSARRLAEATEAMADAAERRPDARTAIPLQELP